VLPDIIRSGLVEVVALKEIFRQAEGSQIIQAAHAINQGILPDLTLSNEHSDFFFLEREDPEQTVATLITMIRERIPKRYDLDPIDDVQVLCPMHRGSLGIQELNLQLQAALNPKSPHLKEHLAYGLLFREGDKIIQMNNNYEKEVFNGDIGRILSIDPQEKTMTLRFGERRFNYDFSELDEVTLAYAITIHKSQGSEFPVVVMPLAMQQYLLLQRNLLYTGVTRGRQLVLLVGQRKALITATHNASTRYRHGGLFSRLEALCK
jgi:exodeoxyribonuclease V alpha subunit